MTIAAGPLVGPVLARVIGIHAARAELPVDRVSDSLLIADALAARAPAQTPDGRVPVTVQSIPGRMEIRLGPLPRGGGDRLLDGAALPVGGRVVERLADSVHVRPAAGGNETLVVRVGTA